MMMKQIYCKSITPPTTPRFIRNIVKLYHNNVTLILILVLTNFMTNNLCECSTRGQSSSNNDNQLNNSLNNSNSNNSFNDSDNSNLTQTQDNNINQINTTPSTSTTFTREVEEFERLVLDYVNDAFDRNFYEIVSGITVVKDNKTNDEQTKNNNNGRSFDDKLLTTFRNFAKTHVINVNLQRTAESGRLFFFKGNKRNAHLHNNSRKTTFF